MNGIWVSIFLAFSSGLLGAFQSSINSQLGKSAGQYMMIVGVSLIQALVAGIIVIRSGGGGGSLSILASPWMIVAGVLGVILMFGISVSISSLGTLTVFVLVITGQILASAVIDHFGLFGLVRPMTIQRACSILLIIAGVLWLAKSS